MKEIFFAAILSLSALAMSADPDDDKDMLEMSLDELLGMTVSSASKTEMSADEAPGIVTVISRNDIENLGAHTLMEVLNWVPGISVGQSFQNTFHSTLYVRGSFSLFSENVLILKNGQRFNDAISGGAVSFSPDLPLTNVEKIEIIRGPGSALYGANAFVALINIITDDTERNGIFAELEAGSAEARRASFYYGQSFGETHLGISASYFHDEFRDLENPSFTQFESPNPPPFPIGVPFNTVFSGLQTSHENESLVFTGSFKHKGFTFRFDMEQDDDFNNWGAGASPDLLEDTYRNRSDARVMRLGLFYEREINDRLSLSASATHSDYEAETLYRWANLTHIVTNATGPGALQSFLTDRPGENQNAELSFNWNIKEGQDLVFGYSYQREKVDRSESLSNIGPTIEGQPTVVDFYPNGDSLGGGNRTVHAVFGQYTWQVNTKLGLTGGIRADEYDDFGNTVNPRAAAVFAPTDKLSFKALYGEAFRAPTFLERTNFISGGILPNEDLEPEEIYTTELQINYRPAERIKLLLSGYEFEIDNVIRQVPTFNPDANFETQTRNQGTRDGHGIEFELRYQSSPTRLVFANYSTVESSDRNDVMGTVFESDVEGVPQDSLSFGFVYDIQKRWVFGLSGYRRWNISSQQAIPLPDIVIPNYGSVQVNFLDQNDFPAYTILDSKITWRNQQKGIAFHITVKNALDEQMVHADQHNFVPGGIITGERKLVVGFTYRN